MSECAIGLPNQALKPLVSSFIANVKEEEPYEFSAIDLAIPAGTETDCISLKTVPTNRHAFMDSLKVSSNVGTGDTLFYLYRGDVIVTVFSVSVAGETYEVFADGVGKEYDEGETWKLTAFSTAGAVVNVSLSGRKELKRESLYSQVLA